ncbi:MAG: hypothetical protein MNPFHGCM_00870 [Gemmatimonadaceae bacterium]|nr:hypothetical protein [Gemmatimonadaceae bacterium]
MVEITIDGDRAHFDVQGWDKLWAFKSHLDIPLAHIRGVRIDPEQARGYWHGVRYPGVQIPGMLTAGTYYQVEGAVFYDVHDPERTIVLDLDHEEYTRLVVEVADPPATVALVEQALARRAD